MQRELERIQQALNRDDLFDPFFDDRMPAFNRSARDIDSLIRRFVQGNTPAPHGWEQAPFLGIGFRDVTPEEARLHSLKYGEGVVVTEVIKDSPAGTADLRPCDIIVSVDGRKLETSRQFVQAIYSHNAGDTIALGIIRSGEKLSLSAVLAARLQAPLPQQPLPRSPLNSSPLFPHAPPAGNTGAGRVDDEIPAVQVTAANDTTEIALTLRVGALALPASLVEQLGVTPDKAEEMNEVLANARNELAKRIAPAVESMLENPAPLTFSNIPVEEHLAASLDSLEKTFAALLSDTQLNNWKTYVRTHRYVSQSISVNSRARAQPTGPVHPPMIQTGRTLDF